MRPLTIVLSLSLLLSIAMSTPSLAQELPDFNELWDYHDPAATRDAFTALLPAAEASGDADYHLQLLTQIARTHSLAGEFDEANALLDTVEAQLTAELVTVCIRYLLERGRTLNSSGDKAGARPLFEQAWNVGREHGIDGLAVDAAHMVAIVADEAGALEWNHLALELAEASDDPDAQRWLGSLYNNLGWTHHEAGRHEQALDLFERALAFRIERGETARISVARWSVGRCLRSLERHDEAMAIMRQLQAAHEAAGTSDGYVQEELGELLLVTGTAEAATPHFARAYELLSADQWMLDNEAERMARIRELGGLTQ